MEKHTLSEPIAKPTVSEYVIRYLRFDWDCTAIEVGWTDNLGTVYQHSYGGTEAKAILCALNTADLSSETLLRRMLARLVTDGRIGAGKSTGEPE